jgi:hypothetical protein
MRSASVIAFLIVLHCGPLLAADAEMPIHSIVEEAFKETDRAVVVPQRLELICRSGNDSPWGFSFAGFETNWRGPLELEVSGSGAYAGHDIYSIAAISLDFGNKKEWIDRSLIGLGLMPSVRLPHPPNWGAGSKKLAFRGNLITAGPKAQRVTIDPAKYAPPGWDGRLWIGLMLHNAGVGKTLAVRIVNATPPGGKVRDAVPEAAEMELVRSHQKQFLQKAAEELKRAPSAPPDEQVAAKMLPYLDAGKAAKVGDEISASIPRTLETFDKSPPGSGAFLGLAEAFFKWQNRLPAPSVVETLNGLLQTWRTGGEVGKEFGCIVRTATNLEKIELQDVSSGRVVTKESAPIEISAARHEYEGFQIILTPLPGCSANVSVTMSELKGDRGTIPASEATVNPVGYVRIFPGQERQRLIPDPLLIGDVPPLKAGENQPVWVTLHVPDIAAPGIYRGGVTITNGKSSLVIPIQLKVRDFAIPKKISLRSSFWMFRDQINRFYHVDEMNFDDYLKWIDFALQHRVNPIDVYEGYCEPLVDISLPRQKFSDAEKFKVGKPNPNADFTKLDRYIDRMVAGGANTIHLGTSHHWGMFFREEPQAIGTPENVERVKQATKIMADHYKAKGVFDLHYLQLRDEVSDAAALAPYKGMHDALPDVKLLLTAMPANTKLLLQIPCPLSRAFDASWRDEIKAKGGEYWWYVCLDPEDPYANLLLHQAASQHRALFWQTWAKDVDGLLYWGLNFWSWYEFKWPAEVRHQTTRVAREDWPAPISIPDHPGDGFSIYPGPTPGQPMSSIRLECMRDGEEDYEYFVLLDAAIEKAQKAGRNDDALRDALAARDSAKKLVAPMTEYEKRSAPYLDLRGKVADAIEKLMK